VGAICSSFCIDKLNFHRISAFFFAACLVAFAPHAEAEVTYSGITFADGEDAFADAVVSYSPGVFPSSTPQCQTAANILGPPDRSVASCSGYVSLGQGGSIVLEFSNPSLLASGSSLPDIHIFEIGSAVEVFRLEISTDQVNWINIGEVSGQPSSVDIDAHPSVNTGDQFAYVRLTDLSNTNNGADIDAVGVNPTYPPPTADAGPDQSVASNELVTLDGTDSASAVNGVFVDFSWVQSSGTSVSLSDATVSQPTFIAPTIALGGTAQVLVFDLVVVDGLGQSSTTDSVQITVNAPNNTPPTADAGPNQSAASGALITLDGTNSNDPDEGDSITYQWRQLSGPAVTLSDVTSARPTFTAPTLLVTDDPLSLVFELVVTDSLSASSDPDRVINPPGDTPPTADAGSNQSVTSAAVVRLDGTNSSDPDEGDSITYQWRQVSGPLVELIESSDARPVFNAPSLANELRPQLLVFELVVIDASGKPSEPKRVVISVLPIDSPEPLPVPLGPRAPWLVFCIALVWVAYRRLAQSVIRGAQ